MNVLPNIAGTIDRRFLVNYRVDPEFLIRQVPAPFRLHLVEGYGVAGICVLRLAHLRPEGLPASIGISTQNAAHRIAVEWDGAHGPLRGVYILRRDTASSATVQLGGRLFPGVHQRADFRFTEQTSRYEIEFKSRNDETGFTMNANSAMGLSPDSVFDSLEEASRFFQQSPLGYSPSHREGVVEGLELLCASWKVQPLQVDHVESTVFGDTTIFPRGSVIFDSALVMRDIPALWRARGQLAFSNDVRGTTFTQGSRHQGSKRSKQCA
jgi:hypothetical protein